MFLIKYIENNMILNQQGEWWAYYELIPYNYAFLSPDEKMAVLRTVPSDHDGKQGRQDACALHCI